MHRVSDLLFRPPWKCRTLYNSALPALSINFTNSCFREKHMEKGRIEIFKNYSKEVEFFLNKVEKEMDFQSGVIYFALSMYIHIVYRQI